MDLRLDNHNILITGASGGIGAATARAFAAEGANLALHYHRHRDRAATLRERILSPEHPHLITGADLRDEAAVDHMFTKIEQSFPRLDAVVVGAGIWNPAPVPVHEMTVDRWRDTIDTNLAGAFLTCRGFMRHLAKVPREHASIVLVASTAALFGEADHADYAASKAALAPGLTLSLKNEIVRLAPRGRVNCVCPGWTDTPMAAPYTHDPDAVKRATATMSLPTIADPRDVAHAIVWLTSHHVAAHVTGAVLPIAGGMEGRLLNP